MTSSGYTHLVKMAMSIITLSPVSKRLWISLRTLSYFCSPVEMYRRKMNDGAIKPDSRQLEIVEKLELLHVNITKYLDDVKGVQQKEKLDVIPPKGMYIHGEVGTGKTMLMDMLYQSLSTTEKARTHFHSFMIDILSRIHKETMNTSTKQDSHSALHCVADEILQSSRVLFIDELQFTDYTSNAILLNLFEMLFSKGVVVIATSNRPISELGASSVLAEEYNNNHNVSELGKLVQRNCSLASLDSKQDYRSVMVSTDRKYFFPLNSANISHISTVFDELVQDKVLRVTHLDVYGRKVLIPESTDCGICRFEFKELCCSPLGNADYIKICNTYHTIFLLNIPVLYFHNKNEARRLINFIDAAYESKVKLYCSAQANPEGLLKLIPDAPAADDPMLNEMLDELAFTIDNERDIDQRRLPFVTGKDEIFAFRRAISRLNEMQSSLYSTECHRTQHFDPYISTDEDQRLIDAVRKTRMRKKLEEERLEDCNDTAHQLGNEDWGQEASWTSWHNDMERRKRQQLQDIESDIQEPREREQFEKRRKDPSPPEFSQFHFWGFGWWENKKKNK